MSNFAIPDHYVEVTDLNVMQRMLVNLFRDFHNICEEYHLRYNMFGGTMLGAVRHKGMIPWDNDIDVTMPRPDYKKLISIVRENYSSIFKVYSYPDKDYAYPFGKFSLKDSILEEHFREKFRMGLYIDIFPVDGYPTNNEDSYFMALKRLKYMRAHNISKIALSEISWKKILFPIKVLIILSCRIVPVGFYIRREIALAERYSYESSEFVLLQGAGWNKKGKLERRVYEDRALYDFEDMQAWGIRDYDGHLTRLYGDYMKMPPEEKRIPNHNIRLFVTKEIINKYGRL